MLAMLPWACDALGLQEQLVIIYLGFVLSFDDCSCFERFDESLFGEGPRAGSTIVK